MIDILLVDDQCLFVESLKHLLEDEGRGIRVSGIAYNSAEAIKFLKTTTVDVVLLDVRMPVVDGVQTARTIHRNWPAISVIMLTTFDDDDYVLEALRNGAAGYLLKDIQPAELIAAIRAVVGGGITMSPAIARKLARSRDRAVVEVHSQDPIVDELTVRDRELLHHLTDALSNGEIAEVMCLGEQTVRNYVSGLYAKLRVANRAEAIRVGRRLKTSGIL